MPCRRPLADASTQFSPIVMVRAHLLQRLGKTDVALDTGAAHPFDPHRTAADGARREEIRRRRRIAFDVDLCRAAVNLARRYGESLPTVTLDFAHRSDASDSA